MKIKLHTKIFIGLVLGIFAGLVFREKVLVIEPVGTVFLNLITMIVVPLVFVSLMLGTASLGDIKKLSLSQQLLPSVWASPWPMSSNPVRVCPIMSKPNSWKTTRPELKMESNVWKKNLL
jgi:hypothetical protein